MGGITLTPVLILLIAMSIPITMMMVMLSVFTPTSMILTRCIMARMLIMNVRESALDAAAARAIKNAKGPNLSAKSLDLSAKNSLRRVNAQRK